MFYKTFSFFLCFPVWKTIFILQKYKIMIMNGIYFFLENFSTGGFFFQYFFC